jgi:hypothetical protein
MGVRMVFRGKILFESCYFPWSASRSAFDFHCFAEYYGMAVDFILICWHLAVSFVGVSDVGTLGEKQIHLY